jgi:hypothetical protein
MDSVRNSPRRRTTAGLKADAVIELAAFNARRERYQRATAINLLAYSVPPGGTGALSSLPLVGARLGAGTMELGGTGGFAD